MHAPSSGSSILTRPTIQALLGMPTRLNQVGILIESHNRMQSLTYYLVYWSATTFNGPACVFVPRNAQQVSLAVTTMTLTLSKFAVRGGGHMPIPGYNGIDSNGILLSASNLTGLVLSTDKSTVSVGPGNRWGDVYTYLAPSNLAAVGGRVGHVGVPGLLLGGGISFYSSQHGFASDNVMKYQVGSITNTCSSC